MSWRTPSSDLGTHVCIRLINLVKQHPILYVSSKKSAPYPRKNRNAINNIWSNIADDIGLKVIDCKRRWKGLKDVYAKIRKRRLQEGALGINNRKKWIYEDFMTFVKFPFEKSYKKALENLEEVDCDDWKIGGTDSNDTAEELLNDKNEESKIEDEEEQMEEEYLDLDLEVDSVPDSEEYEVISYVEKDNNAENVANVKEEKSELDTAEINFGSRFRAIRPKPNYQQNLLVEGKKTENSDSGVKNSTNSTTPVISVSNLNPLSQIIMTNRTLRKRGRNLNCDSVIFDNTRNIKVKNYVKESSDGVSSTSQTTTKLNSLKKDAGIDSSVISNKSKSPSPISVKKSNSIRSSSSNSVELFFHSMAQTVMNLPLRAQAEIKMEICRLVTEAEIQHSVS